LLIAKNGCGFRSDEKLSTDLDPSLFMVYYLYQYNSNSANKTNSYDNSSCCSKHVCLLARKLAGFDY